MLSSLFSSKKPTVTFISSKENFPPPGFYGTIAAKLDDLESKICTIKNNSKVFNKGSKCKRKGSVCKIVEPEPPQSRCSSEEDVKTCRNQASTSQCSRCEVEAEDTQVCVTDVSASSFIASATAVPSDAYLCSKISVKSELTHSSCDEQENIDSISSKGMSSRLLSIPKIKITSPNISDNSLVSPKVSDICQYSSHSQPVLDKNAASDCDDSFEEIEKCLSQNKVPINVSFYHDENENRSEVTNVASTLIHDQNNEDESENGPDKVWDITPPEANELNDLQPNEVCITASNAELNQTTLFTKDLQQSTLSHTSENSQSVDKVTLQVSKASCMSNKKISLNKINLNEGLSRQDIFDQVKSKVSQHSKEDSRFEQNEKYLTASNETLKQKQSCLDQQEIETDRQTSDTSTNQNDRCIAVSHNLARENLSIIDENSLPEICKQGSSAESRQNSLECGNLSVGDKSDKISQMACPKNKNSTDKQDGNCSEVSNISLKSNTSLFDDKQGFDKCDSNTSSKHRNLSVIDVNMSKISYSSNKYSLIDQKEKCILPDGDSEVPSKQILTYDGKCIVSAGGQESKVPSKSDERSEQMTQKVECITTSHDSVKGNSSHFDNTQRRSNCTQESTNSSICDEKLVGYVSEQASHISWPFGRKGKHVPQTNYSIKRHISFCDGVLRKDAPNQERLALSNKDSSLSDKNNSGFGIDQVRHISLPSTNESFEKKETSVPLSKISVKGKGSVCDDSQLRRIANKEHTTSSIQNSSLSDEKLVGNVSDDINDVPLPCQSNDDAENHVISEQNSKFQTSASANLSAVDYSEFENNIVDLGKQTRKFTQQIAHVSSNIEGRVSNDEKDILKILLTSLSDREVHNCKHKIVNIFQQIRDSLRHERKESFECSSEELESLIRELSFDNELEKDLSNKDHSTIIRHYTCPTCEKLENSSREPNSKESTQPSISIMKTNNEMTNENLALSNFKITLEESKPMSHIIRAREKREVCCKMEDGEKTNYEASTRTISTGNKSENGQISHSVTKTNDPSKQEVTIAMLTDTIAQESKDSAEYMIVHCNNCQEVCLAKILESVTPETLKQNES